MTQADEDYGDGAQQAPAYMPLQPVQMASASSSHTKAKGLDAASLKDLAILNAALPQDTLQEILVSAEIEDKSASVLDFSFKYKKRIPNSRSRFARDAYEVFIGRPSDESHPATKENSAADASAAAAAPAKPKLRLLRSNSGKKDTPRPFASPVAAPSSSSDSDGDFGFGRLAFLSAVAPVATRDSDDEVMSLVTWEQNINWRGCSSGSEGDGDAGDGKSAALSRMSAAHRVSAEYAQLLASRSVSQDSSNTSQHNSTSASNLPKLEPLTLSNRSLSSCEWINNILWSRQRRSKVNNGKRSSLGPTTISRHVRLPDESGLKKLLCVSADDFYSVNLHPLKSLRSRQGVEHSAYAKSFKGLSMNISRYTALHSHQVHPPFLCWNSKEDSHDASDPYPAETFDILNEKAGFKSLPPKLPSEEDDHSHALSELSESHHFTCIKGPIAIIEHYQEPIVLSTVGMGLRMVAYSKSSTDAPVPDENDPTFYMWRDSEELRSASFMTHLPESMPCIKTIENNMCTAPVVFHRKPAKHRAFLLVYRDGRLFLRQVPGIHLVGQQFPLAEVPTIHTADGYKFQLNRMLLRINEECPPREWASKPLPVEEFLNRCGEERPEKNQQFITFMKQHFLREAQENEFGEKDKTSTEWMWKKEISILDSDIHSVMLPETACLLRAAYVGEAFLQFCHIETMRVLEGLSKTRETVERQANPKDKKLVLTVIEALKRAPWTLTKSYLEKLESGFLVFDGLGLYCSIDRSKFVTKQGGKNMAIHQNLERPYFLLKMLEAYRTAEIVELTEDKKDDEIRNFLMRRNNLLLQTREDTTFFGLCEHGRQKHDCKECGVSLSLEPRRTLYANHRKLVEVIRVTQLGRSNPYDFDTMHDRHEHRPQPTGRGIRISKVKSKSISTASRKGMKRDEWNSDDESSSDTSELPDNDWFSDVDDNIDESFENQEEIADSNANSPPPSGPKLVIKRPFASPSAASSSFSQAKSDVLVESDTHHEPSVPVASTVLSSSGSFQAGLQAVLKLMTQSKEFKVLYGLFYPPVSTKEYKDYPKVVQHPKCIDEIISSIKAKRYSSCDAFLSDLILISSNCDAFSRSGFIEYNEVLVIVAWGLFVEVTGCFFKHSSSSISQLDNKKWSVQQQALFKIYAMDYDSQDFKFRVDSGFQEYYKLVAKPICLSEIQMHASSASSSISSVVEKVKLLCNNCRMFCASPHGSEYSHLISKADAIQAIIEGVTRKAPNSSSVSLAGLVRIKSATANSGSSLVIKTEHQIVSETSASTPIATTSSADVAISRKQPAPHPIIESHPIEKFVDQLAEEFPDFVPSLKKVMDPVTYKMYVQKIKSPISISDMRNKVLQGSYTSSQFLADVQAIGSNCVAFWTSVGGQPQLIDAAHALMKKGAAFALAIDQQENLQRTASAAPSSAVSDEPPKKKIFLSLKRSGSGNSDA